MVRRGGPVIGWRRRARYQRARRRTTAAAALAFLAFAPAVAAAHPLGNFTINHYAGLRIEPDRIVLDVVIDQAEISAFQARQAMDLDGDAALSDEELDAGRARGCEELSTSLELSIGAERVRPVLTAAGLHFPPGVGGLPTMRLVCSYEVTLATVLEAGTRVRFADRSYEERLGWREIWAQGSGVTLTAVEGEVRPESVSGRLTVYPEDRLARPLSDLAIVLQVTPGGPTLPPLEIPDAQPIQGAGPPVAPSSTPPAAGGTSEQLPSVFQEPELTPVVLMLSLLTALALGAGHALTPGHGKTLMAACLVGTRGTPLHAVGLGLAVSVSHTIGIVVLGAIIVGAANALPPDVVVRVAPVVAALSILGIGAWMLGAEWQRHGTVEAWSHVQHDAPHRHGLVRHRHAPAAGTAVSWRSLFALGLAGGLIPSTSALLILLGSIAAGRAAFGFVLVVAFGLGMAAVMGGLGLALVVTRTRLDRRADSPRLARLRAIVPLLAAFLVFGFGIILTAQALASLAA